MYREWGICKWPRFLRWVSSSRPAVRIQKLYRNDSPSLELQICPPHGMPKTVREIRKILECVPPFRLPKPMLAHHLMISRIVVVFTQRCWATVLARITQVDYSLGFWNRWQLVIWHIQQPCSQGIWSRHFEWPSVWISIRRNGLPFRIMSITWKNLRCNPGNWFKMSDWTYEIRLRNYREC